MLKQTNVQTAGSDLGDLKVPRPSDLRRSPLDRMSSLAAVGAVAAILANPERQLAQSLEGPPPVIVRFRVTGLYHDQQGIKSLPENSWQKQLEILSPEISAGPFEFKQDVSAGAFSHRSSLSVKNGEFQFQLLLKNQAEGGLPPWGYVFSSADTIVRADVFLADPNYRLDVRSSAGIAGTRTLGAELMANVSGNVYVSRPFSPDAFGEGRLSLIFSPLNADSASYSVAKQIPEPGPMVREKFHGVDYYRAEVAFGLEVATQVVGGTRSAPETSSAQASASVMFEYSIVGGSNPEVQLKMEDAAARPFLGVPFRVRAVAKDNDTLGPNPQIRGYKWQNATPLPEDPSRAVVTPKTLGPLTVHVTVIDNEGKTATNKINFDVEGSQICFYVDKPDSFYDTGHAFIGLYRGGKEVSSFVRGFYPAGGSSGAQFVHGFGWGGVVKDDSKHHWDYRLCYVIDEDKRKAVQQFIEDFARSKEVSYHALKFSCIGLVEEVAKQRGLPLPPTREAQIKDYPWDYLGLHDVSDPWVFARSLENAFNHSPQFGDGAIERNAAKGPSAIRRAAPMGVTPNSGDMFGPIALLNYLASNPSALASSWGLRFDSRQLAPLSITAGSTVTLTTPPRDMTNSLSALWWSDSKSLEAQPTTVTKTFSTPGQYSVHFALVDNFEVWGADMPINVVARSPSAPPPSKKSVAITPPSWVGQLDIQRFGFSLIRLFAPATGRELFLQRTLTLPFVDSLPWDSFGPTSILTLDISDQGTFFRVRPGR